ncbi:hypothetical protein TNIN_142481 [Trichonephila inaurata madagascariensis]|uniref:Uncharacterized protein n=1 Tax=Trichonephila inaurata madagascariensis TaxID=2747483 RepID=A0A8X6XYW7_9ARAC|nr:hypothetical protein TNIN_142481 [Trichonephila inaurata madagascariensis]
MRPAAADDLSSPSSSIPPATPGMKWSFGCRMRLGEEKSPSRNIVLLELLPFSLFPSSPLVHGDDPPPPSYAEILRMELFPPNVLQVCRLSFSIGGGARTLNLVRETFHEVE